MTNHATLSRVGLILMSLLSASAFAGDSRVPATGAIEIKLGGMPDTPQAVGWKILAARDGIQTVEGLREHARKELEAKDKFKYHQHRVEVTGVNSTDDTNQTMPDMFDDRYKLTYSNLEVGASGPLSEAWNLLKDVYDAGLSIQGKLTPHAAKTLAPLKGKRIEELVAHSWGAEAIYVALLDGQILPPKKLVIVGVPEANREKWQALAKFTGIEVHVLGFTWDKPKLAGRALDFVSRQFSSGLPTDSVELEKLWASRCAERSQAGCVNPATFDRRKFDYDIDIEMSDTSKYTTLPDADLNHARFTYYKHLGERKIMKSTLSELQAEDNALIAGESERILREAVAEAEVLIAQAKERALKYERELDVELAKRLAGIASQACYSTIPVTKQSLDALPFPRDRDFFASQRPGNLPNDCTLKVYHQLQARLCDGQRPVLDDAVPFIASAVKPPEKPFHAAATPPSDRFVPTASATLSSWFHELELVAAKACSAPGALAEAPFAAIPVDRLSFERSQIDPAEKFSSRMSGCTHDLFIEIVRAFEDGPRTRPTRDWLIAQAAPLRARYEPVYIPPRRDDDSGGSQHPMDDGKVPAGRSMDELKGILNGSR